jgi:hypothetical protein
VGQSLRRVAVLETLLLRHHRFCLSRGIYHCHSFRSIQCESTMSTYTPCFPPSDPKPRQRHLLLSSTSSSSASGGHASFSAQLSKAHLALASVSDYIERPPSPTSAAVDSIHVAQLRRKFRLAVATAYRDTSSGKWAHVSELARLGCTIGRWQGVCSGSKAPAPSTGDRNDQGELFQ